MMCMYMYLILIPTCVQTWDLLQLTVTGFSGLCQDFLARYPGYYIVPVRVNGSVVESLFGRFKYNAGGHLSAINYQGSVEKLIIADATKNTEHYRKDKVNLHGVLTKKKYNRKNAVTF